MRAGGAVGVGPAGVAVAAPHGPDAALGFLDVGPAGDDGLVGLAAVAAKVQAVAGPSTGLTTAADGTGAGLGGAGEVAHRTPPCRSVTVRVQAASWPDVVRLRLSALRWVG